MTTEGVNHKQAYIDEPTKKIPVNQEKGRVRVLEDSYDYSNKLTPINTDVMLSKIPRGARVQDIIAFNRGGTQSVSFAVGYSEGLTKESGETGYEAAKFDAFIQSTSSALRGSGTFRRADQDSLVRAGFFKTLNDDVFVTLRNLSAIASSANTGTVSVVVYYVLD